MPRFLDELDVFPGIVDGTIRTRLAERKKGDSRGKKEKLKSILSIINC